MTVIYRGHEIDAHRAESMGGDDYLYYSIFRVSDGYELTSGFTGSLDTIEDYIGYMKERVDNYLANPREEHPDDSDEDYARHLEQLKGL